MDQNISIRANLQNSNDIPVLRETIARFQRILSGSDYGFWEWDLRTQQIDWFGGFWESSGFTFEDEHGISDPELFLRYLHPDDHESNFKDVIEHFKTGKPFDSTYRVRTKDGNYIWQQVKAHSIRDENGRVIMMSGISCDVTGIKQVEEALRKSEARQERIIQSSNDGIWEWTAGEKNAYFSRRCWELIGFDESDDEIVKGNNRLDVWRQYIHPQDLQKFDDALNDHLEQRAPFDIEYRLIGKNDNIYWIRARGKAIFNHAGQPIRMSGSNMDMTRIKNAEERVLQAKEGAEKANQAKSEFLSSMSHELRTPLNAILGYSQLFEYDLNLTAQQINNIREIRKAGEHLLNLINDVLDLAKIESGKMTVSLEPILISRLIEQTFMLVQPQADARNIKLFFTTHNLHSHYIIADNVRFKQALINLLSNAIKYNNPNGEVEVHLQLAGTDKLRILVRDSGKGIPARFQAEMFQPFNRLNAENSKEEGTGVGLVITKQLVEMMHGSIGFTSQENVGTEFWIELPLATGINNTSRNLANHTSSKPTELAFSDYKRILYIEDNPTNVLLLQHFFHLHNNMSLDVAEDAFMGIYKARNTQPDLIILDINLPGMDGFEALNILQHDQQTKTIPVIGLSANAMPYDIERGLKAGFLEYLTKPVDINSLINTLNKIFAKTPAYET